MSDIRTLYSQNICPHLGLKHDSITPAGFPTSTNICYHSRNKSTPRLEYQSSTCLTQRHKACPLYSAAPEQKMPEDIRYSSRPFLGSINYIQVGLIVLLVIVIIAGVILSKFWLPKVSALIIPDWQKTQQARSEYVLTASVTPSMMSDTSTAMPTHTSQSTISPTSTNTMTETPIQTTEESNQVLDLDTPIGFEKKFIIHRAAAGETLGLYATQYNTTVSAIREINYRLPTVLYVDQILVIPLDITDVSNLPIFETYQISADGITVPEIVEELGVTVDAYRLYNNIPINYIFTSGEWVLVPRQLP